MPALGREGKSPPCRVENGLKGPSPTENKMSKSTWFAAMMMTLSACGTDEVAGRKYTTSGLNPTETAGCSASTSGAERCAANNAVETCMNGIWILTRTCAPDPCVAASATTVSCTGHPNVVGCTQSSGEYSYCDGVTIVSCNGRNSIGTLDCSDLTGANPTNGTCYDFGEAAGAWCVVGVGGLCAYAGGSGETITTACGNNGAPSASMGCDYVDGCVSGVSACTPATSFTPYCTGQRVVVACSDFGVMAQPLTIDCGSEGLGSATCADGHCLQGTAGGPCLPGLVECGEPQVCSSQDPAAWGTCGTTGGSFTGIGDSIDECQGQTSVSGSASGVTPTLHGGFSSIMDGATNVFGFSRAYIDNANFAPAAGEYKMRLMFTSSMGGSQYGGVMFIGQWDAATQRWNGPTTDVVVIDLADYSGVDGTGLLCNGRVVGQAQGLFNSNEMVIVTFAVPALTPSFPH
jgi:hypothetical protein